MSVANALLKTLASNGVTHLFGVPGGPLFAFYQAISEQENVRSVLAKHEAGAAFMALGNAQARNGLGVVCTTTGPGGTNALTGVASANTDGVPVLALTAQIATSLFGKGALQDSSGGNWGLDLVDVYRSATKLSAMLAHPHDLPRLARHAVRTALSGRPGAVHLSIPADLMTLPVGASPLNTDVPVRPVQQAPDPAAVAELARHLMTARRPVILAGQGAKISRCSRALVRLAEWGSIPVATTVKGKSVFPEDHRLSLGVFGFAGNPVAHQYLLHGDCDLLLVLGSGLGEMSTDGWNRQLFDRRLVAQIDIDPLQIGKHSRVDAGVAGDVSTVLEMLLAQLPVQRTGTSPHRLPAGQLRYYRSAELQAGHDRLQASAVVARLSETLPADTMIFADNGNCLSWLGQFYVFRPPGQMFVSLNVGSMGYAMGASIGGKIARPERPVVALVGDAAFAMNGMEVHTAVEYGIPVIWVVLNNGGHAMVHNIQDMIYGSSYDALYRHPLDIAQVSRGLGAQTATVTSLADLDRAISFAGSTGRPCVIDVHVDPDEVPWALRGRAATLRSSFDVTSNVEATSKVDEELSVTTGV